MKNETEVPIKCIGTFKIKHTSGVVCQYDAEGWHDGGGISLTGWGVFLSFCIGCDGVWWGWVGGTGALWGPW